MTHISISSDAALQVAQQAVTILADWAEATLASECSYPEDSEVIAQVKQYLSWSNGSKLKPLSLLFDQIKLSPQGQQTPHYCCAIPIDDTDPEIPYPQKQPPSEQQLKDLRHSISRAVSELNGDNWQNLSLLSLILEKFGSCLSFGESDVALVDLVRATGAIATILTKNPEAKHLSLVAGDLSGIQKFIYTISADGALKSLRARSFYLELVTEEIVQQLLLRLELPRTNVIYAGGGNLYLLAPATKHTQDVVTEVKKDFNEWLFKEFQGKVFLALSNLEFPIEDVANSKFAEHWESVIKELARQKNRKFDCQMDKVLPTRISYNEPCRVCHRDDVETLKPLNLNEPDSVLACGTCRQMYELGSALFRVDAIVRSPQSNLSQTKLSLPSVHYHLFSEWTQVKANPTTDTIFAVNDWSINHYLKGNVVLLLLGNYGQEGEEPNSFIRAAEMAERAKGIKRVGYLRMDVDRLGLIFAKGLGDNQTLPRLAGLSRQMSYFFTVYLNSLAKHRLKNPIDKKLTQSDRPNLLFIYAGGDDLFVSGSWNEVVEFAFDVYQCFRAYTGNHPDITLSGGISVNSVKYPLYKSAKESGEAEDQAKYNGKDSLGLFGEVFKWSEWLGTTNISVLTPEDQAYLSSEAKPELFGIFPFVEILNKQLEVNQLRSFVQNLLATAQVQQQMLKDFKSQYPEQIKDIRYYLHLPKIAYTIARLPSKVRDDPNFEPVRTSLKSPYNAMYFRAIATWIELLNRN